LHLVANSHALAAEDALARIANKKGIAGVNERWSFQLPEALLVNADIGCDLLQFTMLILETCQAVIRMIGQQQFNNVAADFIDMAGIGTNSHSLSHRSHAGSWQALDTFDFHQA